jgi:hypothetical protein
LDCKWGHLSPELPALIAVRYFKSEFGRRICHAQNEFSTAQAFGLFWGIRNVTSRADWDKIHTWSCLVLSNPAAIVGLPAATTAGMPPDRAPIRADDNEKPMQQLKIRSSGQQVLRLGLFAFAEMRLVVQGGRAHLFLFPDTNHTHDRRFGIGFRARGG